MHLSDWTTEASSRAPSFSASSATPSRRRSRLPTTTTGRRGRQVDIDAAAEADEADALASCHASALAHESHDPPAISRQSARADLLARIGLDDKGAPLILSLALSSSR